MSDHPDVEHFEGSISVRLEGLPSIQLVSIRLDRQANWFLRIAEATRRRYFTIRDDWQIELSNIDYLPELNGAITVPRSVDGKPLVFDGASVPLPWLVSFLTLGLLRPLGVMLTASIVHDFAFKYGYLWVTTQGASEMRRVDVERHVIDRLFRDIINTVNQVGLVGWVAWVAVRLGWLFGVPYSGERFTGFPPIGAITALGVLVAAVVAFVYPGGNFVEENFTWLVTVLVLSYVIFYLATLIALNFGKRK